MFKEVTAEILELSRDLKFVRNLSLTAILAIACVFGLSDLQSHNTTVKSYQLIMISKVGSL
jgi:hypothetical protein